MNVIKRDGRKETFNADKIMKSVEKAAKDAKLDAVKLVKEIAEPAIEFFKKKKIVKTADIKKFILEKFDKTSKKEQKTGSFLTNSPSGKSQIKEALKFWKIYEGKKTKK